MVDLNKIENNLNDVSKHVLSELDKNFAEFENKSVNSALNRAFCKSFKKKV